MYWCQKFRYIHIDGEYTKPPMDLVDLAEGASNLDWDQCKEAPATSKTARRRMELPKWGKPLKLSLTGWEQIDGIACDIICGQATFGQNALIPIPLLPVYIFRCAYLSYQPWMETSVVLQLFAYGIFLSLFYFITALCQPTNCFLLKQRLTIW